MPNITYTPYVANRVIKTPEFDFLSEIPIVNLGRTQQAAPEEVVVAPLPEVRQPKQVEQIVEQDTANPIPLDWNDNSTKGKGRTSRQYLMDTLGLKDYQAAALVGSFMRESGLNVNAENKDEKAGKNSSVRSNQYGIGIGQWTRDRHDDFVNWTTQHGNSLQSQLDFAADEIRRKYPEFLAALKNSSNADEASDLTYVMYTGGNYRDVSGDKLAKAVAERDRAYGSKHIQMYGKDSGNHSSRRRQATREALTYKLGGVIKMQFGGYTPDKSVTMAEDIPGAYVKEYNLEWNPFTDKAENSPIEPEFRDKHGITTIPGVDMDNLNRIADRLKEEGFTKEQSAALLATVAEESKANPNAVGDNGKSKGIMQWQGNRFKSGNDLDSQIDLLINEIRDFSSTDAWSSSEKYSKANAFDAFNSGNLEDMVTALTYNFVRPKYRATDTKKRYELAQKIYNELL